MKRLNLDPRFKGKAILFIALTLWAVPSFGQTDTLPAIRGNLDIGGMVIFRMEEKVDTTMWYCAYASQDGYVRFDSLYCITSGLYSANLMFRWAENAKRRWFTSKWDEIKGIVILMRARQLSDWVDY